MTRGRRAVVAALAAAVVAALSVAAGIAADRGPEGVKIPPTALLPDLDPSAPVRPARISSLYPAVEALTALLAVTCVAVFGPTAYAALAVGFCALLVTLSAIDIKTRIVPNRVPLVPFLSLGAVVALFFGERVLESYLGLF